MIGVCKYQGSIVSKRRLCKVKVDDKATAGAGDIMPG